MNYNPQDAVACWPEGLYEATITECEETTSNAGNDMYAMKFKAYRDQSEMTVRDWYVNPSGLWKMKRLANALGRLEEFNAGDFDPRNYIGRNIRVRLIVEETEQYGDQNRVDGYAPSDIATGVSKLVNSGVPSDEDDPF